MEPTLYLRFVLALILVLGLILGLAWVLRRLGMNAAGPLARRRRLRTVEGVMLDSRHRAVLIRRDDIEHLVLIGPNTSQVIERGIPAAPLPEADERAPASGFRQFLTRGPSP